MKPEGMSGFQIFLLVAVVMWVVGTSINKIGVRFDRYYKGVNNDRNRCNWEHENWGQYDDDFKRGCLKAGYVVPLPPKLRGK